MAWWNAAGWNMARRNMAWPGSVAAAAMRHRMDAALVGVLLAGSLGFADGTTWLEPDTTPSGAGKAFVVIAPRRPATPAPAVTLPNLAYSGAAYAGPGSAPRFTISATTRQPAAGDGFVAGNRPGGGLALGPQVGPRIAIGLPSGLVFGNGPAQLSGGYAAGHSAPAVPEPSTWALIVMGMGLTAAMARRRRKRLPA